MVAKSLLAVALCLWLMAEVRAQAADDMAYCAQLSDLYRRYLGSVGERVFPDVAASVAMDECAKGNTAAGIPVLEKKLRDARFTLPKRSQI
jgi:hypothetical protein